MSTITLEFLEKIRTHFAVIASRPDRESLSDKTVVQYNVTLEGKVVHTLVVNLKDFVLTEEPTANDIEITIADEDVITLWENKTTLVDLKEAVSLGTLCLSFLLDINE